MNDDDHYTIRLDGVNMQIGRCTPLPDLFIPHDGPAITAANVVAPNLHFSNGKSTAVTIKFDGDKASVELSEDITWDDAAKLFWNAVCRMMSQPKPFPEMEK